MSATSVTARAQDATLQSSARVASADAANCGAGALLSSGVRTGAVSSTLIAPPLTSIERVRRGELAAPLFTTGIRFAPAPGWLVRGDATAGPGRSGCALFSELSRGWIGVTRGNANTAISLSYGLRDLSPLDPSRTHEGITVGLARRISRVHGSLEARRRTAREQSWRHFLVQVPVTTSDPDTGRGGNVPVFRRDSATQESGRIAFDLQARTGIRFGPLALDLTLGGTHQGGAAIRDTISGTARSARGAVQWWGRTDATLAIARHITVNAAMIALPGAGERAITGNRAMSIARTRNVASLGVAIIGLPVLRRASRGGREAAMDSASMEETFDAAPADAATIRVRARIRQASRVEVASELTGWRAVAMERTAGGWWETTLTGTPGTYRVNLRVDGGAWRPPAGVPVADDEFNGQVGLVSIDERRR